MTVGERLRDAMNAHDIEALVDFTAKLVRAAAAGDVEWLEWRWAGDRADGNRLDVAGVMVLGMRDGRIATGSLYMEPVEAGGEGIGGTVRAMAGDS